MCVCVFQNIQKQITKLMCGVAKAYPVIFAKLKGTSMVYVYYRQCSLFRRLYFDVSKRDYVSEIC